MTPGPRGRDAARRIVQNRGPQNSGWYRIRNAEDGGESRARIDLYDEIGWDWLFGGTSAADLAAELAELDVEQIDLHINSPGGDVYEGIAILNAFRQHPARVVVTVDGLAASAASFIAMAGDEVIMARNAEMMIHEASGICLGNAADMRDFGDRLDKVSDNIASIYADRAGGEVADWRASMTDETWYSDAEAVDAGLADRVSARSDDEDGAAARNRFDLSIFAHAGRRNAPAPPVARRTTTPPRSSLMDFTDEQTSTMCEQLGLAEDADAQTIVDALVEALAEQTNDDGNGSSSNSLPAGVTTIDASTLADLQARAARGDQARTEQETSTRNGLVDAAIRDGRIPPSRRDDWVNLLATDPGSGDVLAGLAKNTVPLEARGRDDAPSTDPDDDALYAKFYGQKAGA